ncbi:MAG TPA: S-methyl-5'-thioadenosine phosphorylase [Bacteroidales bacterium]|jgi:5'-methylthioadenosine phosphorylase|nr:S-methyl-5'-thioadenosine phosphorylase [Bacteroidales bacterium]HOS71959.1 S-methyl-5'-thioadenosine phosphorylase [Bacteroidales bacterium]HQH25567.1 S-methyl-5'-thioadenosine phosphorylase [Bacteroidales bacterium]HQJ82641.1 S-methyl-5'-thioadenosine phosphorylase [Bacteroidales bacterium]
MVKIGIIGGSGLEDPEILDSPEIINISNKYGSPASPLVCGKIGNTETVILSRHGKDHTIPPSAVNNRANISALADAGCTHIISTTACGSLREEIQRGDIIIPDQFIDFTRHRYITFFDEFEPGNMGHTPMADPFDRHLRSLLISAARKLRLPVHDKGVMITIEGPRFSTRAESHLFRMWGADIINMSVAPEAILANEIKIPYATIAMSTDYDSWKKDEQPVTWEEVLKVFNANVHNVLSLLREVIPLVN